jgi:hypothetical protein
VIAVALMMAQLAPAEPKPVATTIAAIRANPKRIDGRVVRLHGWVNQCKPLTCWIEERAATAQGGPGAHLSIATDPKFDATVRPLIPTYVEFDARFSATCLTTQVCLDRAPELTIVSLRAVVSTEPPPIEN